MAKLVCYLIKHDRIKNCIYKVIGSQRQMSKSQGHGMTDVWREKGIIQKECAETLYEREMENMND